MEIKFIDENIGKKSAWTQGQVIGENVYYSVYTTQITDVLSEDGGAGVYQMKEGDIFSASAKNTNKTIAQTIRGVFYSMTGQNTYTIAAQHSGVVTATGSK